MKQYWQRLAARIDARTARERLLIFAMAASILIMLINAFVLQGQLDRQQQLSRRIKQDQARLAEVQGEIRQKSQIHAADPDAENRKRLQIAKQQLAQMHRALGDMQKGLVSPDKMAELLEGILRQNARLRLISLKTLPASALNDATVLEQSDKGKISLIEKDRGGAVQSMNAIYKHGVELVVQGSYPEIAAYLADLERMPWQLFWSKAVLDVEEYPKATLTLTLYTLSLDKRWLNI
jgi:MSHA biogenesis protein MshJ